MDQSFYLHLFRLILKSTEKVERFFAGGSSAMATSSVSEKVVTNDSSAVALHPAEGLPHM